MLLLCVFHTYSADWTGPTTISATSGVDCQYPVVDINSSNNAWSTWAETTNDRLQICYFNGSTNSWGSVTNLSSTNSGTLPRIKINNDGKAIVIWRDSSVQLKAFNYNESSWTPSPGTSSGTSITPNVSTINNDYALTMNNDGKAFAIFTLNTNPDTIRVNYFDGTNWDDTSSTTLLSNSANESTYCDIAMNDEGEAVAIWRENTGTYYHIFGQYYDGSSWKTYSEQISLGSSNAYIPAVAIDSNGNAFAVYYQDGVIKYSYFNNGYEEWETPASIPSSSLPLTTSNVKPIRIVMNASGDAMVVWNKSSKASPTVAQVSHYTGSWSTQEISDNSKDCREPCVAMNDNGGAITAWFLDNASGYLNPEARDYTAWNDTWNAAEFLTDQSTYDNSTGIDCTISPIFFGITVWREEIAGDDFIIKSSYLGAGPPI